jgi:hypothetical protein
MVVAVQCPEPRCRKYMLVEEEDRGKIVPCLICKTPIRVGMDGGSNNQSEPARVQHPLEPDDDD